MRVAPAEILALSLISLFSSHSHSDSSAPGPDLALLWFCCKPWARGCAISPLDCCNTSWLFSLLPSLLLLSTSQSFRENLEAFLENLYIHGTPLPKTSLVTFPRIETKTPDPFWGLPCGPCSSHPCRTVWTPVSLVFIFLKRDGLVLHTGTVHLLSPPGRLLLP